MIRQMSLYDVVPVCEMLVDLKNSSPEYSFVVEDWDYVPNQLKNLLCNPKFIGVIDDDYRGFMIGAVDQYWYSSRKDAFEQTLLVNEEARGGMLALRLIKAFEKRAKELGAEYIHCGSTTGINEERTIQLYERMGYQRMTASVRKKL